MFVLCITTQMKLSMLLFYSMFIIWICKFLFKKLQRLNLSRWGQSRRPVATVAVVTIMVLVLVVVGAVLLQDVTLGNKKQRFQSFDIQDIIQGKFMPNSFNGTWVSGNVIPSC